jgi:hypothetical protein
VLALFSGFDQSFDVQCDPGPIGFMTRRAHCRSAGQVWHVRAVTLGALFDYDEVFHVSSSGACRSQRSSKY